jgi:hypothetical protein
MKIKVIGSLPELFQLENCILQASLSATFCDAQNAVSTEQAGPLNANHEIATVQVAEEEWPQLQKILTDSNFHIGTAQESIISHLSIPIVADTVFAMSRSGHNGPAC